MRTLLRLDEANDSSSCFSFVFFFFVEGLIVAVVGSKIVHIN